MSLAAAALLALSLSAAEQDPAVLFQRGIALKNAGKIPEAIAAFDAVIAVSPDDHEAFNNRGALRFMLSDFKGADEDFSRAIVLSPKDPKAWGNRCLLAVVEERAEEGLPDCVRALREDPQHYQAYNNIGYALFELDKIPEARNSWKQAAQLSPESAEPLLGLAIAALRSGERRDCPTLLKGAIALKPLIGRGPERYEAVEGPFFAQQARRAVKELLRLFPVKVKARP